MFDFKYLSLSNGLIRNHFSFEYSIYLQPSLFIVSLFILTKYKDKPNAGPRVSGFLGFLLFYVLP